MSRPDPTPSVAAPPRGDGNASLRTCPNCGGRLLEEKCKLRCPDPACGSYLSCSDCY